MKDDFFINSLSSTAQEIHFVNGKVFYPTLYSTFDYLSVLWLKLIHVSERDSSCYNMTVLFIGRILLDVLLTMSFSVRSSQGGCIVAIFI